MKEIKYKWAYEIYGGMSEAFDTEEEVLEAIANNDEDPADCTFYRLEEGAYVPPSTPAHIKFG